MKRFSVQNKLKERITSRVSPLQGNHGGAATNEGSHIQGMLEGSVKINGQKDYWG